MTIHIYVCFSSISVCFSVVNKLSALLSSDESSDAKKIETKFSEFCKTSKKQDNRFCYYVGGLEESATKIVGELTKPLSWGLPADKICERLHKKDAQICDLRYERTIDLATVEPKKLRVKDLKKILNDHDEKCENCIEKAEFVAKVEELQARLVKSEL